MKIDWPNQNCLANLNVPTTITNTTTNTKAETITFDDIEQLCIRMAEHALEINGKCVYGYSKVW